MNNTLLPDIKARLKNKRLIFTITTGRSGTKYLAQLLSYLSRTVALHEPKPLFSNVMRQAQTAPSIAYKFWIEQKLPYIANLEEDIYIETSHLFCKGFVEPLINMGIVPDIIIHTRPRRAVAYSFYKLGRIPGRSQKALHWLLSPNDPNVLQIRNWQNLHDYQLCFWYCLEIARRGEIYKKLILGEGGRVAYSSIEQVCTSGGLKKLMLDLKLDTPSFFRKLQIKNALNKKVNTKSHVKEKKNIYTLSAQEMDLLELELIELISF